VSVGAVIVQICTTAMPGAVLLLSPSRVRASDPPAFPDPRRATGATSRRGQTRITHARDVQQIQGCLSHSVTMRTSWGFTWATATLMEWATRATPSGCCESYAQMRGQACWKNAWRPAGRYAPDGRFRRFNARAAPRYLPGPSTGRAYFPSMVQARSMNARSSSLHGSRSLPTHSPLRSPAGSSTPTAADSLTVCDDHFPMAIAGTNIHAICSPMNRQTSYDCAGTY
jgi:hypothetical protein